MATNQMDAEVARNQAMMEVAQMRQEAEFRAQEHAAKMQELAMKMAMDREKLEMERTKMHEEHAMDLARMETRATAGEWLPPIVKAVASRGEGIAAVAQVPLATIQDLQRIWIGNADFNAAMTYLSAYELTHFQVTTLVEKFGSQVVPLLETDPYLLVRELPGFGFRRVDKIARKLNTDKELPSRIRAGLRACVAEALDEGHCWVEYGDLLDRAEALLVMDTLNSRQIIERHLEAMISAGALVQEVFEQLAVGLPEIVRMERDLAAILKGTASQRVACGRRPTRTTSMGNRGGSIPSR
jgi:hypothetical protein